MRTARTCMRWLQVWCVRISVVALLMLVGGCGPRYDTEFVAKKVDPKEGLTYHVDRDRTRVELPAFSVVVWLKRFERGQYTEGYLQWDGDEDDAIGVDVDSVRVRVTGRDKDGYRRRFTVRVTRRLAFEWASQVSKSADSFLFDFDLEPPPGYPRLDPDVLDVWYKLRYSDGSLENGHFRLHLKPQKAKAVTPFAV